MTKAIYLDMDGTFVNLYGVENWLEMLIAEDTTPYAIAKPLVNFGTLARVLNKAQRNGWHIGVVTWTSKGDHEDYDRRVEEVKREYLKRHLPSVKFDEIKVVKYGTPKATVVEYKNGILFDDEPQNRNDWFGTAFDVQNLTKVIAQITN